MSRSRNYATPAWKGPFIRKIYDVKTAFLGQDFLKCGEGEVGKRIFKHSFRSVELREVKPGKVESAPHLHRRKSHAGIEHGEIVWIPKCIFHALAFFYCTPRVQSTGRIEVMLAYMHLFWFDLRCFSYAFVLHTSFARNFQFVVNELLYATSPKHRTYRNCAFDRAIFEKKRSIG